MARRGVHAAHATMAKLCWCIDCAPLLTALSLWGLLYPRCFCAHCIQTRCELLRLLKRHDPHLRATNRMLQRRTMHACLGGFIYQQKEKKHLFDLAMELVIEIRRAEAIYESNKAAR